MAGHSKWSKIKRKKADNDAKRGKLLTRLLKEIQMAAKIGGGSPEGNPRLKTAIQTAKSNSVPADNIEKAIKRGTGDIEGVEYEEVTYEGYGPGGVAILIKTLTDNKNRTVAEVRHALSKGNGSLGSTNSVAYQFDEKAVFTIAREAAEEEALFEALIDSGVEDISDEGDVWELVGAASDFDQIRQGLEGLGLEDYEGGLKFVPQSLVKVEGNDAVGLVGLLDRLDDLDDVQDVIANFDMDEAEFESLSKE